MNTKRAFTLLEILISVVVLAIGLVGVVAIFPAVIDLQRRAQDTVIGVAAASSAEAEISGTFVESDSLDWLDTNDWVDLYGSGFQREDRFPIIDILKRDLSISTQGNPNVPVGAVELIRLDFLWDSTWDEDDRGVLSLLEETGDLELGGGDAFEPIVEGGSITELPTYTLTIGQRLMPDASTQAPPRYVYDLVARRVDVGVGEVQRGDRRRYEKQVPSDRLGEVPVQLAIFTRRVDRNIRIPSGVSLRDSLSGSRDVNRRDQRFPLAVDATDLAKVVLNAGVTNTDNVVYSRPIEARFRRNATLQQQDMDSGVYDLLDPRTLQLVGPVASESVVESLTQVGQMFVDNQGVVRTVTEIIERDVAGNTRELLVVDPPFSTGEFDVFQQIVFTPQVPVGIRVVTTR